MRLCWEMTLTESIAKAFSPQTQQLYIGIELQYHIMMVVVPFQKVLGWMNGRDEICIDIDHHHLYATYILVQIKTVGGVSVVWPT